MLYLIGPKKDAPQAIGMAPDPAVILKRFQAQAAAPLVIHKATDLDKGIDQLAHRIATHALRRRATTGPWFGVDLTTALTAFESAVRAASTLPPPNVEKPDYAGLISYLRTQVFGASQLVFGQIAGGASNSLVSRWEKGELEPGLSDLHHLRAFATKHGLPWNDSWIFQPPLTEPT